MSPLLAKCFGLLLLLGARCWRPIQRARLEIHRWYKRPSKLLLSDERMKFGLLGRPSLERVDCKKAADKVNERDAVVHFYHG